ncbi:MAG: HlyD family efflux transporter periplasmic adaptor subunit [Rhizomicrobium sp.]
MADIHFFQDARTAGFRMVSWFKGADAASTEQRLKLTRERLFLALGSVIGVLAVAGLAYWFLIGAHYVSTDDAYVNASSAQVTPLTSGKVQDVRVHDTQLVKRGDVLVVIDPEDAKLAVERADAAYQLTYRKIQAAVATAGAADAQIQARQADYARTKLDYDRRVNLVSTGAVSREELSAVKDNFDSATAGLSAAKGQYQAAMAMIRGTDVAHNPEVLAAKAALDTAKLNLDRTVVRAPLDGIIAQRQVQIGQMVGVGIPLMAVVPVTEVYVDANFKEGQLDRVRPGQPVSLKSDLYGSSVTFHGHVAGIGGGTGSAFAVIPAQNATGNWIKVVQRVPVRIALDPAELAEHPLRVGLSMTATIDVSE